MREDLLAVIDRGAALLIVDMTATVSCDHLTGVLAQVYQQAVARGTQLRLVIATPAVRRAVAMDGLDRLIPVFPALEAAQGAQPGLAAVLPLPRRPAGSESVTPAPPEHSSPLIFLPVSGAAAPSGSGHSGPEAPDSEPEDALTRLASDIFRAGLTLQDALDQPAGALRRAAEEVLELLDMMARDARTAAFARIGWAEAVPRLLGVMGVDIVPHTRLLALEAAHNRTRARQARARTVELATRAAAIHDRVAISLSRAAVSSPLRAHHLLARSDAAASQAIRMRQWADDHTATG